MESLQGKIKGENEGVVSAYLWRCPGETVSCGAAQFVPLSPSLVSLSGVFLAAGHNGRHPKNWLSGNPTVQPAVQAAGTDLKDTAFDEVGASAVANAQTPQPGSVGPLDDLSTDRVALWLHGYFHARTRGAHCTQRGHGNRRSPFLYAYQRRFDGGSRKLGYINFGFGLDTQPARSTGLVLSIVNFLVCIRSRFKNMTRSFEHREAGNRDVTSSMAQHHLCRRPGWLWRWSGAAPEFVGCHVISTWCAYFLVLRWVPRGSERGVSDPTGLGIPLRSFSFLRSLFSLQGNWE